MGLATVVKSQGKSLHLYDNKFVRTVYIVTQLDSPLEL